MIICYQLSLNQSKIYSGIDVDGEIECILIYQMMLKSG